MDPPPEYLYPTLDQQTARNRNSASQPYNPTQLYEDTTYANNYNQPQAQAMGGQPTNGQQMFPGQQLIQDPMMANMAMQYGQSFAASGKDMVEKKLDHFLSVSKLKYYFAVDTNYVVKKLGLVSFPFAHSDWSLKYDQSEPVAPRYEINAPDLYIPTMAFVTYILICGLVMGTQNRFDPEQLGIQASSILGWLVVEIIVIIMSTYVFGISASIRYLDLLALCGYKYVGMITSAVGLLLLSSSGYYLALCYTSLATAFFVARSLKLIINPENRSESVSHGSGAGTKRRLYILVFISLLQPIMMYFLTRSLHYTPPSMPKKMNSF